jgi:hypothetical protein
MERRAEGIEAGERDLAVDHGLMREAAARAAVFLRDSGAEQARRPELVPGRALHHAVLGPLLDMRHEFGGEEAACLLLEQHEVFGHPGGTRDLQGFHRSSSIIRRADC